MFGSDLLGIAVGLILLYLLLSVLASAANEMIESLLKVRARYLARSLRELLGDRDGTTLVRELYDHPLISGLFPGSYDPKSLRNLPSYIPSHAFALALLDIARMSQPTPRPAPEAVQRLGLVDIPLSRRMPPSSATTIIATPEHSSDPAPEANPIDTLRKAILNAEQLGEQPRRALLTLIDSAGGDIDQAMVRIEAWYDSAMDRVSGRYKRHVQWMLLALGLAIAGTFNADTLAIFHSLANDPAERNMLLDAAREYAKSPPPGAGLGAQPVSPRVEPRPASSSTESENGASVAAASGSGSPVVSGTTSLIAPPSSPAGPTNAAVRNPCDHASTPECLIENDLRKVHSLGLPLGWRTDDPRLFPGHSALQWILKIVGIVLTAIAITMGAPFWFDMLNKVMMARAALKPVEPSKA